MASFSCTVTVAVELPSAAIEVGLVVMVLVTVDAVPALKLTLALSDIATLFKVPLSVALPAVVLLVSVAE